MNAPHPRSLPRAGAPDALPGARSGGQAAATPQCPSQALARHWRASRASLSIAQCCNRTANAAAAPPSRGVDETGRAKGSAPRLSKRAMMAATNSVSASVSGLCGLRWVDATRAPDCLTTSGFGTAVLTARPPSTVPPDPPALATGLTAGIGGEPPDANGDTDSVGPAGRDAAASGDVASATISGGRGGGAGCPNSICALQVSEAAVGGSVAATGETPGTTGGEINADGSVAPLIAGSARG